jgi:hypothetical protein
LSFSLLRSVFPVFSCSLVAIIHNNSAQ